MGSCETESGDLVSNGDNKNAVELKSSKVEHCDQHLLTCTLCKEKHESMMANVVRGVNDLWTSVNHVAIVVSDVGTSLSFYTDVVGMKQVMRPNFDRHGAWLTVNNVDLHLIKGRPAVHPDDDLIVGHIAITVSAERMDTLRERLTSFGVKFRRNVSVPNPTITEGSSKGRVDQVFVRDPDGYYIEFCSCELLEDYLTEQMQKHENISKDNEWDVQVTSGMTKFTSKLKDIGNKAKVEVHHNVMKDEKKDGYRIVTRGWNSVVEEPKWKISDDEIQRKYGKMAKTPADPIKLGNLLKRRKVYGDIAQNASEKQLEYLLVLHQNNIPMVIKSLEEWIRMKQSRTYIPPAFYDRDGSFVQPPTFEMPAYVRNGSKN